MLLAGKQLAGGLGPKIGGKWTHIELASISSDGPQDWVLGWVLFSIFSNNLGEGITSLLPDNKRQDKEKWPEAALEKV